MIGSRQGFEVETHRYLYFYHYNHIINKGICMKTTRDERIARVVLGLGVMFVGSFSFIELAIAGYLIGLLLIGIGVYPKSTEYESDDLIMQARASGSDKAQESAAKAASPRKKTARRKKSTE